MILCQQEEYLQSDCGQETILDFRGQTSVVGKRKNGILLPSHPSIPLCFVQPEVRPWLVVMFSILPIRNCNLLLEPLLRPDKLFFHHAGNLTFSFLSPCMILSFPSCVESGLLLSSRYTSLSAVH